MNSLWKIKDIGEYYEINKLNDVKQNRKIFGKAPNKKVIQSPKKKHPKHVFASCTSRLYINRKKITNKKKDGI